MIFDITILELIDFKSNESSVVIGFSRQDQETSQTHQTSQHIIVVLHTIILNVL